MILEKIRTTFPETNRTQDQDLLIGSSCLALTDKERDTIENLNFNRYHSSLDEKEREDLSVRVAEAVAKAQMWGTVSGFTTGGVAAGASAWYLAALTPLATIVSGVGGAVAGRKIGHYAGGRIGHRRAIKNETNSSEYILWRNEKFETIIFPALSRYVDPNKWSTVQLECPITLDWMMEPVRAEDGHIYEKSAILAHLAAWEERQRQMEENRRGFALEPLSPQELQEVLQTRSPLRNGNITVGGLRELPDYYKEIFRKLECNYNTKVSEQQSIAAQVKDLPQPFPEEVAKVVRWYSMTQRERNLIEDEMRPSLLRSTELSDEEVEGAREFLNAAAKLPKVIMTA